MCQLPSSEASTFFKKNTGHGKSTALSHIELSLKHKNKVLKQTEK